MACLKEGVLLKMVEEMKRNAGDGCEKPAAATSVLLQIRSIIPVLDEGDLWPDRGFFLKVSDSSHALYVSLSKQQNEMVLSNKLHLGQFIYVSKLEDADPLPLLRGVVPMPGRRPCEGSPVDIFSPPPAIVGMNILRGGGDPDPSFRRSEGGWRAAAAAGRARSSSPSKGRPKRRSWSESEILGVKEIFDSSVVKQEIKIPSRSASANVSPVRSRCDSSDDNASTISSISSSTCRSRVGVAGKRVVKRSEVPAAATKAINLICDRKGAETRISWTSLPSNLVNHGKEVIRQRDVAVKAAAEALQEACASERLLNSLSTMSQLPLSEGGDLQPFVDKFLNLHHDLAQTKLILQCLTDRGSESETTTSIALERRKNANAWVKSAIALDLSPSHTSSPPMKTPKQTSPSCALSSSGRPKGSCTVRRNDETKVRPDTGTPPLLDTLEKEEEEDNESGVGKGGSNLGAAAGLARSLDEECKKVLLRCVDRYLEQVERKSRSMALYDDHEVAGMMTKVKMVSDWLNTSVKKGDENEGEGEGEACAYARARDKIYGILLKHVERTTAMALDRRKISI